MTRPKDPVQEAAGDSRDLYEIATWEPRTRLDGFATWLYRAGAVSVRAAIITVAVVILLGQLVLGGLAAVGNPLIGALVILSVVPAFAIAGYIWYIDVTTREPLGLLVTTFLLGILFAGFAGVLNAVGFIPFAAGAAFVESVAPDLAGVGSMLALAGFFFLIVGPIEEAVKLLAVRLHAYRSDRFDAVINGAVYGAAAGLGFATIENALYIVQGLETEAGVEVARPVGEVAATRALAGPGHVLYSAIAGYYLGLAKFNPDRAGPLVVKGLVIAAVLHALYNTLVGTVPGLIAASVDPVSVSVAAFGFIVVYLTGVGYFLFRKIAGYHRAYRDLDAVSVNRQA